MNLNLMSRKEYFCNGNNEYYCRTKFFGPEAPFEIKWEIWNDKVIGKVGYVETDVSTANRLEFEYFCKYQ